MLGDAFRHMKDKYPFNVEAIVVLPDHIHAVWSLPEEDFNYSVRWHQIKSYFTKGLIKSGFNRTHDSGSNLNCMIHR